MSVALSALRGAASFIGGTPVFLTWLGFTPSGIAGGSFAATLMSLSATLSGGGVPAGGLIALLQSIGAAGLGPAGTVILGTTGAILALARAE